MTKLRKLLATMIDGGTINRAEHAIGHIARTRDLEKMSARDAGEGFAVHSSRLLGEGFAVHSSQFTVRGWWEKGSRFTVRSSQFAVAGLLACLEWEQWD
ncbi:MAG TPA: hypothetical protein VK673_18090 [Chthoniobacterales bacterium]|nr:hypothetical protein [Chthoniobacterales bacterium]